MSSKKFLVIGLLSLFMVSMFAGVVSAESVMGDVFEWASSATDFSSLIEENGEDIVAQWLLFFLVVLIVYAISAAIPFLGKDSSGERSWLIRAGVSVVVGILAVFFLNSEEILTILQTYKTLGIALTVIVPFFIVAVVSKQLNDQRHVIMSKFVWILFLVTLAVRYVSAADEIGAFGEWAFVLTAIASIIMIIFSGWVYFQMFKHLLKGEVTEAGNRYATHLTAKMEKILSQMDSAGPDTQKKLEAEYDDLQAKLDKANAK